MSEETPKYGGKSLSDATRSGNLTPDEKVEALKGADDDFLPPIDRSCPIDREIYLVEYQAAQASAQHHDQIVWTSAGTVWAGNLAGLALLSGSAHSHGEELVRLMIVVTAIALNLYALHVQSDMRAIKKSKYKRCRAIEEALRMTQHSRLTRTRKYTGSTTYHRAIFKMFIVVWVLALVAFAINAARPAELVDAARGSGPASDLQNVLEFKESIE